MTSSALATWRHRLHEFAFRTLFRLAGARGDRAQQLVCRIYFGWVYRRPDPWGYETTAYEITKYDRTLAAIRRGGASRRAMEAGCSEGRFTALLLSAGLVHDVVGVDISEIALTRARARCAGWAGAAFTHANIAYTAPDGPFDLIICSETLYYLGARFQDACSVLSERLAEGGRIVAVHPANRLDELHGPWHADPRLRTDHLERVEDDVRPYVIEIFTKAGPPGTSP